ncbi:hypothetical protein GGX14DRAFT_408972 [Mycena pura]|uniref:Uncharacterized protein n=1 Tax=Mycena pura TaxID=153505 RepID=A0AAD6Y0T8_9AGAR|nr:hypothetical protein GGX14DRAFT_408972 [Mycena pura]
MSCCPVVTDRRAPEEISTTISSPGIGTVPYWYGVRLGYGAAVAVPYCHLAAQVRYGYGTIGYSRPLPVPAKPVPLPATAPAKPVSSPACACASREVHHAPMRTKPTHPAWLSARAGPAPSGRHKRNRWAAAGGAGGGNTAAVVHGGRRSRRACGRTAAAVHGGRCGRRRRAGSGPYTVPYPYTAVPYPYHSRTRLSGDWYETWHVFPVRMRFQMGLKELPVVSNHPRILCDKNKTVYGVIVQEDDPRFKEACAELHKLLLAERNNV